jgi:hypothetical protein
MAPPSDLRRLQERFFAQVTRTGAATGAEPDGLADLVAGDQRLDEAGRVAIYADMYFERLKDALQEDFPKLFHLLGEEASSELVADFLAASPPATFSLRELGAPLPAFLAARPALADRPWLEELGRLEWSRVDLFDGPDSSAMTLEDLRRVDPDRFADLALVLIPTHRLLPVRFAVEETWRRIDRDESGGDPGAAPGHLLVWRKHTEVLHRRPTALEAPLLAELAAGTSFGLVCERLGAGRSVEEAAPLAFQLLAGWAEQGLLVQPPNELK